MFWIFFSSSRTKSLATFNCDAILSKPSSTLVDEGLEDWVAVFSRSDWYILMIATLVSSIEVNSEV